MNLTFQWDTSQAEVLRSQGLERALFRALSMAGGDAIRAAKVASSRIVRFRKHMRVARVNRGLVLRFPKGARAIGALEWRVGASGDMVPVSAFKVRQYGQRVRGRKGRQEVTSGGTVAKINARGASRIENAFIQRMKSGHVGVFLRTGAKVGPRGGLRPFSELFTSRISDVFRDAGMIPAVHARAQAVFSSSFARLLPLELAKAKK